MATDNLTEEQVRMFVRDEWARLEREKQDRCDHARSGTLRGEPPVVVCDDCGKELRFGDESGSGGRPDPIEQRGIDFMRSRR